MVLDARLINVAPGSHQGIFFMEDVLGFLSGGRADVSVEKQAEEKLAFSQSVYRQISWYFLLIFPEACNLKGL